MSFKNVNDIEFPSFSPKASMYNGSQIPEHACCVSLIAAV